MKNFLNKNSEEIKELLIDMIEIELDYIDKEEMYDNMINGTTDTSNLPDWLQGLDAAEYLQNNDPVTYRCGLVDYIDSISRDNEYTMINDELYNTSEMEDLKQEFLNIFYNEMDSFLSDIDVSD